MDTSEKMPTLVSVFHEQHSIKRQFSSWATIQNSRNYVEIIQKNTLRVESDASIWGHV